MKHIALSLLILPACCGAPAFAVSPQVPNLSPATSGRPVFVPSDDENVVGHIVLHNKHTLGLPGVSLVVADTPAGEVLLEYNQTPNDACPEAERPCADTLEVLEVPSGYAAIPYFLTVEEGGHGAIRVVPILGF